MQAETATEDRTPIDSPKTWTLPLDEVDESIWGIMINLVDCPEDADDYFYPEDAPRTMPARLAELEVHPLLKYGEEDGPAYENLGVIWDKTRNEGWLYLGVRSDELIRLDRITTLTPGNVFPLVERQLMSSGGLLQMMDEDIEFTEKDGCAKKNTSSLDSLTWNPQGFDVYDDKLVPVSKMKCLIEKIYGDADGGWIRDICPTPESWLQEVYDNRR